MSAFLQRADHLLVALLIGFPGLAAADEPADDDAGPNWRIEGEIPGQCRLTRANLHIRLEGASLSSLSDYRDVWPTTGGERIMVYFETDASSPGAEYCGFVYRRVLVLKRASSPGLFNITVDAFPVTERREQISVQVPAELLRPLPVRIWTADPGRRDR